MSVLTPAPVLGAAVRVDALARRLADGAAAIVAPPSSVRTVARGADTTVRNEVAPLVLIAVIAVAAAVALILVVGIAAAWLYFCQSTFGPRWWPTVGVPTVRSGFYYFGCRRV